jgi:hypothetical protein
MTYIVLVTLVIVAAGAWYLLRQISQQQADTVLGVDAMARYIAAMAPPPTAEPKHEPIHAALERQGALLRTLTSQPRPVVDMSVVTAAIEPLQQQVAALAASRERAPRAEPQQETVVPPTVEVSSTILLDRGRRFVRAIPAHPDHMFHAIVVDNKGYRLVLVDPEGRRYFVPTRS